MFTNLRSIDGFKIQGGVLWLFQMTGNIGHGVHTQGIFDLLKSLSLLESFRSREIVVQLLFIVSEGLEVPFQQQTIELADVYKPEMTLEDIRDSACDIVPGIGPDKKKKLQAQGINSVADLLSAHDANMASISLVRQTVQDCKTVLVARQDLVGIAQINQSQD